jgi:hypothetical protein
MMVKSLVQRIGMLASMVFLTEVAVAGTCCNTPTVWTIKNLDKSAVTLTCSLEKSAAWSGKPISMSTGKIAAGGTRKHTWSSAWYSDGMGMIPGSWACRASNADGSADVSSAPLAFTTDWGENIIISWERSKGTVARK